MIANVKDHGDTIAKVSTATGIYRVIYLGKALNYSNDTDTLEIGQI